MSTSHLSRRLHCVMGRDPCAALCVLRIPDSTVRLFLSVVLWLGSQEGNGKEGRGHCVVFETSAADAFEGQERSSSEYLDYILLDVSSASNQPPKGDRVLPCYLSKHQYWRFPRSSFLLYAVPFRPRTSSPPPLDGGSSPTSLGGGLCTRDVQIVPTLRCGTSTKLILPRPPPP